MNLENAKGALICGIYKNLDPVDTSPPEDNSIEQFKQYQPGLPSLTRMSGPKYLLEIVYKFNENR